MRICSSPHSRSMTSITRTAAAASSTSAATARVRTPKPFSSPIAASRRCWEREQMAMLQPSAASCLADARPMPWLPPVTRANFPERPKSIARSGLERPAEAALVAEEILAVQIGGFQAEHVLDGMHDRLGIRIELVLEFAHRRARRVSKADALDRRLQLAE